MSSELYRAIAQILTRYGYKVVSQRGSHQKWCAEHLPPVSVYRP
jgi:predicted RNA binding protein YcfA (HicA-like mRNA interferase family)